MQNKATELLLVFFFGKKEFITLLHASSVVVLMSKLCEGWNRVAHEALLCQTPVIGSGIGGMNELLTKSGQIISTNENLREHVSEIILTGKKNGQTGYAFVKQFDMNYFNNAWQTTIKNLLVN